MTIVVVDPKDIREDAEQVELGLVRLRGQRFEAWVDEVYESHENERFRWFHLRAPGKKYTRRQIAKWMEEIHNDKLPAQENPITDWWSVESTQWSASAFKHQFVNEVRRLIQSAQSLNALELHVEARTMRFFEEAYEAGDRRYKPAE